MTSPHERAERELGRVLTRLAALGPSRLSRAGDDGATPADRVRPVLQQLADAAADLEGRRGSPPAGGRRVVPVLADRALGDQLAVLGRDLLDAAAAPHDDTGGGAGGRSGDVVLTGAADRLTALRRAL